MNAQPNYSRFPFRFSFPDVDPAVLARDEGDTLDARGMLDGAWTDYLRRVLPPVTEQGTARPTHATARH